MGYFSFLGFAQAFAGVIYDLMKSLDNYSGKTYYNANKKEIAFTEDKGDRFASGKEYLARQHQDRKITNRKSANQNQKNLERRLNLEIKNIDAKIERKIQTAFSEDKRKSRRWEKRHRNGIHNTFRLYVP